MILTIIKIMLVVSFPWILLAALIEKLEDIHDKKLQKRCKILNG